MFLGKPDHHPNGAPKPTLPIFLETFRGQVTGGHPVNRSGPFGIHEVTGGREVDVFGFAVQARTGRCAVLPACNIP
ncbi:hypothetical protein [Plantactinospora sp. DSM 117369]